MTARSFQFPVTSSKLKFARFATLRAFVLPAYALRTARIGSTRAEFPQESFPRAGRMFYELAARLATRALAPRNRVDVSAKPRPRPCHFAFFVLSCRRSLGSEALNRVDHYQGTRVRRAIILARSSSTR